ncbi:NSP5 [Rotavirus A]|uniref:Non-structural protein 5 n=1 Tax=Rotavirus A TaxID=28875 RepID=A0A2D0W0W2_9REOV|nr:NSP5 [Rotavirus A]
MSLTIDVADLPSITSSFFNDESSNTSSTLSGKSIGRSEQYVSSDAKAFTAYMLSKSPEDIAPSDSASNDPLTSFSIRSNAVKTNADGGVSMDTSVRSRPSSDTGCDQIDFHFAKGLKVNATLDSNLSVTTQSTVKSQESRSAKEKKVHKSRKHYPKIEAESDSDNYVVSLSDSDDDECVNCKYKKKYYLLKERMKKVAMQLISDL